MVPGTIIEGEVLKIENDFVIVDAGLKSEAFIPISQFINTNGELTISIGDIVEVALEAVEDSYGETRLSRDKAKRLRTWEKIENAHLQKLTIQGLITGKVKGGFTIDIDGVRAFLPGSLVDTRPIKDTSFLENKSIDLKLIKIDSKRNNIVVSRKAVIEEENSIDREELLNSLKEGSNIKGVIKNLTDYGAFMDLGGVDGLLHITDMSWKRIHHPSEILSIADEITVKVLKFDKEKQRVSLGLKQLGNDPWHDVITRFPKGKKVWGRITNIADYGCFIEIDNGIEGLVHVTEMDWKNKNVNPHKILKIEDKIEVVILDIDIDRRRISLGLKQCVENPWETFNKKYNPGDIVSGKIKSITDFGVFLGLEGDIDGLIHLSDLSWDTQGEDAVKPFNKGDIVDAIILNIDVDRNRISLGIKQLIRNPISKFTKKYKKGDIVNGIVHQVKEKQATITIGFGIKSILKNSNVGVSDMRNYLKIGNHIKVCIKDFDFKKNIILISCNENFKNRKKIGFNHQRNTYKTSPITIGDLIKEKIEDNKRK